MKRDRAMDWKKLFRKSICLLAVLFLFGTTAGQVFAGSISDAQLEKEALKGQLSEAQELIEALQSSEDDIQEKITQLDGKLTEISGRISELELLLTQKETEISSTQQELEIARENVAGQYESMKVRIRFMYENSSGSYLETLLSAKNLSEFLNRAEYIYQISKYDREMLERYQASVETVDQVETVLSQEKEELTQMALQVQEEQSAVSALLEEKEHQLAQVGEELSEAQQLTQIYEAEIQAQDEIIAMIQAEEARKQEEKKQAEEKKRKEEEAKKATEEAKKKEEAEKNQENADTDSSGENGSSNGSEGNSSNEEDKNGSGGNSGSDGSSSKEEGSESAGEESSDEEESKEPEYNGGAFTWPCPSSTRVTSDYGPRTAPTGGASSYHRGIDIGAAYGADIVAAADGTVSFAGYSNAAGNYVTVSHGNGVYTVYMHCSSLNVSKGQGVSAGQVIAKVGSTGISTGNHLHFGVSLNGSYVNPWDYLQ